MASDHIGADSVMTGTLALLPTGQLAVAQTGDPLYANAHCMQYSRMAYNPVYSATGHADIYLVIVNCSMETDSYFSCVPSSHVFGDQILGSGNPNDKLLPLRSTNTSTLFKDLRRRGGGRQPAVENVKETSNLLTNPEYINIPPQTAVVYHGSMTACPLHSPDMVAVTNIRRLYLDVFMDIQNRSFFRDQFSELRLSPSSFFGLQSYLEDHTSPLLLLNGRRVPLYDNHTSSLYKWKWEQSILTWSKGLFTVEPYRSNHAVSKRTRMPYHELVSRVKSDISHWEHLVRVVQDRNISTDRQVEFHTPTNNNFPLGMSAIAQALGLQEEVKALYPPYTPEERNLYLPLQLPTTPRTECYTLVTTQAPAFMLRGSRCILPMPVVVVHDISDDDDTTDDELNNMLHAPPPPPNDATWDPEATVAGLLTEILPETGTSPVVAPSSPPIRASSSAVDMASAPRPVFSLLPETGTSPVVAPSSPPIRASSSTVDMASAPRPVFSLLPQHQHRPNPHNPVVVAPSSPPIRASSSAADMASAPQQQGHDPHNPAAVNRVLFAPVPSPAPSPPARQRGARGQQQQKVGPKTAGKKPPNNALPLTWKSLSSLRRRRSRLRVSLWDAPCATRPYSPTASTHVGIWCAGSV